MTRYGFGVFILRMVVPVLIATSVVIRPSFMSLIYFVMLMYLPFINLVNEETIHAGIFKYVMIFVPYQTGSVQFAFYIYTWSTEEILQEKNSHIRRWLKDAGFSWTFGLEGHEIIAWLGPEFAMIFASILYNWAVRMMVIPVKEEGGKQHFEQIRREQLKYLEISASKGKAVVCCLLLTTALWKHSLFGLYYLLCYLFFMTCRVLHMDKLRISVLTIYTIIPIMVIDLTWQYLNQIPYIQWRIPEDVWLHSVCGIYQLILVSPAYGPDFTNYVYNTSMMFKVFYPIVVYITYYCLVNEAVMLKTFHEFTQREKRRLSRKKWRLLQKNQNKKSVDVGPKEDKKTITEDYLKGRGRGSLFYFSFFDRSKNKLWNSILDMVDSFTSLICRHAYVGAICNMMMWSVTFINMMSFVLLMLGILLWTVPHKKMMTVIFCFPVCIFSYANMSYTYLLGLDVPLITNNGLLTKTETGKLSVFNFLEWNRELTLEIMIKIFYTILFWLTIYYYIEERKIQKRMELKRIKSEVSRSESKIKKGGVLELLLHRIFVQYWIVLMAVCLYVLAITGREMNIFRIFNMFKYLIFMLILQLSFKVWRKILYVYMIFLILMSICSMMVFYLYQFQQVVSFLKDTLGFSEDLIEDLGITHITTFRDYINRVLIPTLYIVMTLIQMNFFHKPFLKMTDENDTQEAEEDEEAKVLYGTCLRRWMQLLDLAFLLMEMHLRKLVIMVLFLMCIYDACAVYFIILFPMCIAMLIGRYSRACVILWATVVVSVHTMTRMIFALRYIDETYFDVTCNITKGREVKQIKSNFANWLGFKKYDDSESPLYIHLLWPNLFVAFSALWSIVVARQRIVRKQHGLSTDRARVIFPNITLLEADNNLMNHIKYVLNYGYYRMGYEISMICLVLVIVIRMDVFSIIYCVWLCILLMLKRSVVRWVWAIFVGFMGLSISWQYIMAVGLPPQWCQEYDWEKEEYHWIVAQHFLFLVNSNRPPPIKKLGVEALLCLFAARQLHAFVKEIRLEHHPDLVYDGGSNDCIAKYFEDPGHTNPASDFTTYTRSNLDIVKRLFFHFFFWCSLWVVLLGSVNRVEIFSLSYFCHVIVYLWYGMNLYYKPLPLIRRYWNFLLAQNVFVILVKMFLQVVGCFWLYQIPMTYCPYLRLVQITCIRRFVDNDDFDNMHEHREICQPNTSETLGITWDLIIFSFLIIQKRVFVSYHFFLMIDDAKAELLLASRGAIFWNQIQSEILQDIKDEELRVRQRISQKLEMVKREAKRVQGPFYEASLTTHNIAMKSGDYFMFTDVDSDLDDGILFGEESLSKKCTTDEHSFISLFSYMFKNNLRLTVRNYWDPEMHGNIFKLRPSEDTDDDLEPYTWISRIAYFFRFCWVVLDLSAVNVTIVLNTLVNEYAEVRTRIDKEKRLLKETTDYMVGVRYEGWWIPRGSYDTLLKRSKLTEPKIPPTELSPEEEPNLVKLVKAVWMVMVSKSDVLCYFFIIMNQVMLSQLITLPLSSMVFFWGSLSNPRPSRTFWIILIGYLQLVILLKCIFQFDVMPGNQEREVIEFRTKLHKPNPFHPSVFLGLHRQNYYYIWEMFALIAALFHRTYLRSIGFWTAKVDTTSIGSGNYILENGEFRRYRERPSGTTEDFPKTVFSLKSEKASILDNIVLSITTVVLQYATGVREFYHRILLHTSQKATDLYTFMFLCDLTTVIIMFFGFPSFSENDDSTETVASYFESNQIPVAFVMILFGHFVALILDRCIYLKRSVLCKLIFYIMHCTWAQMWTFIMLPQSTNGRMAKDKIAITMYYIFRCLYLVISAYQIRCGYPTRIWGYFCGHEIGIRNFLLFWTYGRLPFLYEMRQCLDWMFTDTSMSIFDWFKMEDIFYKVHYLRCKRILTEEYSKEPGMKVTPIFKYIYGTGWCLLITGGIFLPMMLYSWGKEVAPPNIPLYAELSFYLDSTELLYSNTAVIYQFDKEAFQLMKQVYNAFDESKSFMYSYKYNDIAALAFNTGSKLWMIQEQQRLHILKRILGAHPIDLKLQCRIHFGTEEGEVIKLPQERLAQMHSFSKERYSLAELIRAEEVEDVGSINFRYLMPKFLKIENNKIELVDKLMLPDKYQDAEIYRNITMIAHRMYEQKLLWWEVTEERKDQNYKRFLDDLPFHDSDSTLVIYVFSDRVVKMPNIITAFVSGTGVLALYGICLFMFASVINDFALENIEEVFVEENELPNINKLFTLILMVYVCREKRNWEMEEWAYSKCVFCCRSRDTFQCLMRGHPEEFEIF